MTPSRGTSAIEWLVRPWVDGSGSSRRAGRVLAVAGVLVATVLPGMILYFGIDGWWWDQTLSVCVLAPAGIILFDWLADHASSMAPSRVRGAMRIAALACGLAVGVFAGYAFTLAFRMTPDRTTAMVLRDYGRTMGILVPVVTLTAAAGASLWYRAEAYRLQSAAATASFHALKGQMQPHFLFNSLNALKELIAEDPTLAASFTQRLADLYRLMIRVSTEITTPLSDELAIVGHYFEVERVRFGDRLRYRIDVPNDLAAKHVPSLMLQTLAENAIKHGVAKARGGGEVRVHARLMPNGALALEVSNTGAPYEPPPSKGDGSAPTGLSNTRARLELMYGKESRLTITSDPDLGTRVRFVVSGEKIG